MDMPKTFLVTCHTDHVSEGSTFVAIPGHTTDGRVYIRQAIAQGAKRIVVQASDGTTDAVITTQELLGPPTWLEKISIRDGVQYLTVSDGRKALAILAAQSYGHPAHKLKIIAVTGTKGKTTTVHLLAHILRSAGYKTEMLSTVTGTRTTMPADWLHAFFAQCVRADVEYVIMEVSAHACTLDRVYGIPLIAAGFSGLAHEHLEFYKTIDEYFEAKRMLFDMVVQGGAAVINTSQEWGRTLAGQVLSQDRVHLSTIGDTSDTMHNFPFTTQVAPQGGIVCTFDLKVDELSLYAPSLLGSFNGANIALAALLAREADVNQFTVKQAVQSFQGVPGRLQGHKLANGAQAFVDYAHNPSSFTAVLSALGEMTKDLIVVFGCGGERDNTKRPLMGEVAARLGQRVFVTGDNPRGEDEQKIIEDILSGIAPEHKDHVHVVPDRAQAIRQAAAVSRAGSIIAILGKGHETTYVQGGDVREFDDFKEIAQY